MTGCAASAPKATRHRCWAAKGFDGPSGPGDEVEVIVDRTDQAGRELALVGSLLEQPVLLLVGETAEFHQGRGDIWCLEHDETGGTVAVVEQLHLMAEFAHELARQAERQVVGLAPRQI